jgi:hypothetical protein
MIVDLDEAHSRLKDREMDGGHQLSLTTFCQAVTEGALQTDSGPTLIRNDDQE